MKTEKQIHDKIKKLEEEIKLYPSEYGKKRRAIITKQALEWVLEIK